jgi:hypothetical protein
MPTQSKIPLPGYPSTVGFFQKLIFAGDHFGSNNYQAGGYTSNAADWGLSGIESFGMAFGGINIAGAATGTYTVRVKPSSNNSSNNATFASCFTAIQIQWYTTSNNAEVANGTDLSGQCVRVDVRGV